MLDKLHSLNRNDSAFDSKFHVCESTICVKWVSLNRHVHRTRARMHWLTKMLWAEAFRRNLCFPKSNDSGS